MLRFALAAVALIAAVPLVPGAAGAALPSTDETLTVP